MDIQTLKNKAETEIKKAQGLKELDEVFRRYLGRKGELTSILRSLSGLEREERIRMGREANELRDFLRKEFEELSQALKRKEVEKRSKWEWFDFTAPGKKIKSGHLHPLTTVQWQAEEIFQGMGFSIVEGPEIETEWYNFDALNIPPHHPARDLWDTFWLRQSESQKSKVKSQKLLLRTHTSPVQIRYMESHTPPLRIIAPGRIFRYEATDARHEINFYQLEGLMVGKKVSAANFKGVIEEFYRRFFGKFADIRLRPSYFPFTEPSFEVDMSCVICGGRGAVGKNSGKCASCGGAGWMEMMGAGMVHPNVFKAVGYRPQDWQGFAFGMGLDRLAMMKYKIDDIRLLYSGDLRFLHQF